MDTNTIYIGQWKNGLMNGRGFMLFCDGGIYEGYLENNNPNGSGMLIDAKGNVCIGNWKNG